MLNDYTIPNSNFINLTEESQKTPIRYALGAIKDNGVTNVTPWFLCRDYFNDFILYNQWFVENEDNEWPLGHHTVYGYNYSVAKNYNWNDLFLLVDIKGYELNKGILIEEFSKYETILGTNTKFDFLGENKLVIIVPDVYKNNHVIFGWFTFILRYCINVAVGAYNQNSLNVPESLHYTDRNVFYCQYKWYNNNIDSNSISILDDPDVKFNDFLVEASKLPHKYFLNKIANIAKKVTYYSEYEIHNNGLCFYLTGVYLKGGF